MSWAEDRDNRRLAGLLALTLLVGAALAAWLGWLSAQEVKRVWLARDAALAGALLRLNLSPAETAALFTAETDPQTQAAGAAALRRVGYAEETPALLLPEVDGFYRRALAGVLALAALMGGGALACAGWYVRVRERRLAQATAAIEAFLAGKADMRLEGQSEGQLAQLFNAVNTLSTSLTAHSQREAQGREFLKDTISDISHQLKTPLAALQLYVEIIREENSGNAVIEDFTARSVSELNRMQTLILNLLKLARLDAGAITLEKTRLRLRPFLEEIRESFRTRAVAEGKTLSLSCPEQAALEGDGDWLLEAISNLVKNALDHTAAGGRVEIECGETPLLTTLSVRDDGAGIAPEDLPHVFKRFYRSRFSQDRQGIGIGLTLARVIVEKHGGTLVVESEPGRGAVFQIAFPKLTNL